MIARSSIAGFIAAEGHFSESGHRFAVRLAVGKLDRRHLVAIRAELGVGTVMDLPPRREGYEGEARWQVQAVPDLVQVIVPLCDQHLLPSRKLGQYVAWRAALAEHVDRRHLPWFHGAKICSVRDCVRRVRAMGLCRVHYYDSTGR